MHRHRRLAGVHYLICAAWVAGATIATSAANADDSEIRGRWTAEVDDDRVWLELRRGHRDHHRFQSSSLFTVDQLVGLEITAETRFELQREAGTLRFRGGFDPDGLGSGTFGFHILSSYRTAMAGLGYRDLGDEEIFRLAIFDVTTEDIHDLARLGYDDIPIERLVELAIHGVTPDYIRELAGLGYHDLSLQRLVEMRIHRVTPEFIERMSRLGYRELPAERLIEMRIHRVTPEFVRDMAELSYERLPAERLIEMRIHRVTPEFVRRLAELGYDGLTARELIELRIHGLDPARIAKLSGHG